MARVRDTRTDFEELLRKLGQPDASPPPLMQHLLAGGTTPEHAAAAAAVLPALSAEERPDDELATLERALRAFDERRGALGSFPSDASRQFVLDALESWLRALAAARTALDVRT